MNPHTGRDFVQFRKTESVLNKGAKKIALLFNPPPVLSLVNEIELEIEDILQETEVANCNVAQGYKVFKRLKELRLERKVKSQELNCLYALTDYIDCDALADTCEGAFAEVKEIMNVKDESIVMNVQVVGDEPEQIQVVDTMQDMVG